MCVAAGGDEVKKIVIHFSQIKQGSIFLLALFFFVCSGIMPALASKKGSRKKKASKALQQMFEIFQEQPTVTAGSKIPVKQSLAPYSVSVISSKDIQTYQPLNFGQLLQRIPGVNVVPFNDGLSFINIRGITDGIFNQERTLFVVDGIPMWANLAGINISDQLPVDFQDIKNIEVIRTPTTVSGVNDDEGLISITTKNPEKTTGVRVSAGVGSQGTYTEFLSYGGKAGHFSYRVDSSNYNSDVWRPENYDSPDMIPHPLNPYNQDWKLSSQMRYTWKDSQVNILFGRTYAKEEYGSASSLFLGIPLNIQDDLIGGDYIHKFGKKSQLTVTFSHNQATTNDAGEYFDTILPGFLVEGRDQFGVDDYFSWGKHEILSYGVGLYNLNINTSVSPSLLGAPYPTTGRTQMAFYQKPFNGTGWDLYFQNKSGLTRKDWLYYGARYDRDWSGESGFAPFISYVHQVTEGTALRANINVAYRFPDPSEDYLDWTSTGTILTPPPYPFVFNAYGSVPITGQMVNPEKVTDYELSYGGFFTPRFKARTEFYLKNVNSYIDRKGFMVTPMDCGFINPHATPAQNQLCGEYPPFTALGFPVIEDVSIARNIPNAQIAGAELTLDYQISKNFTAYGNYRNQTTTLQFSPSQAALLLPGLPPITKMDASPQAISTIGLKYEGKKLNWFVEMYSFSHILLYDMDTPMLLKGSNQINVGVTAPLWNQVSLGLASYDIFNAPVYIPWTGVTVGGRFQMTLQYRF